jgi:hypothetical protein
MPAAGRRADRTRPSLVGADGSRELIVRALARRAASERLLLALVLVERMTPHEVACTLGLAPRSVERHVAILLGELRRAVAGARGARSLTAATRPASRAATPRQQAA